MFYVETRAFDKITQVSPLSRPPAAADLSRGHTWLLQELLGTFLSNYKFENLNLWRGIWVPNVPNPAIKASTGKRKENSNYNIHVLQYLYELSTEEL